MSLAWIALFFAGSGASLLLIHAGRSIGYQHYPPPARLLTDAPSIALALVALQALLVAWGVSRRRVELAGMLRGAGGRALGWVAIALLLTSATLSRDPLTYAGELVFAFVLQLVQLGNVILIALSVPASWLQAVGRLADRMLGPPADTRVAPAGPDRFAWGLAAWVTLAAGILALVAYQRHPHVPDEVVYLIHAKYFAAGKLAMALPPVPDAFSLDLMSYQPARWFSPVPPGWPAVLAIGAFFGVPWLVNPLLAGINVLLASVVLRALYPRRTARIALLLFAVSPWNLFMAMNFMTHTATLTFALGAAAAVARLRRDPRVRWALLGGASIGLVGLIRPLEGMAVALLLGVWSLGARGRRVRLVPSAALTLATIATGALVFPYNRALTGSARVFPIMAYTDAMYGPGSNALGFGANRGQGWPGLDPFPGHGLIDVVVNANQNLFQINVELLGWATGSLLLILLLLASRRLGRSDWLMLTVILVVAGIHSFYWFSGGPDFGARYWYLIILPALALAARGLEQLESAAASAGAGRRVLVGASVLVAATLLTFVPWRAVDKYFHYRGMRPEIRRLALGPERNAALVLVRGRRHPDYASAVAYNPVDLRAPRPLYAWDRGQTSRRQLVEAFPDRRFWLVNGPSVTGRSYQIVAGPLTGAELLARADSLTPLP